jgi:hypothetical protein
MSEDDMESLLPTWWTRFPPTLRWRNNFAVHEIARLGGMPITPAVFERIPDHEAYVEYYLYLATWPGAAAAYRTSHRGRRLHYRAVLTTVRKPGLTPTDLIAALHPLIELSFAPVWEEFLICCRDGICTPDRAFFDGLFAAAAAAATTNTRILALFLNPTNVERSTAWMRNTLATWQPADESTAVAKTRGAAFANLTESVIVPAIAAAAATIYETARARTDHIRDELLAMTWGADPHYMARWCLTAEEADSLRSRWPALKT